MLCFITTSVSSQNVGVVGFKETTGYNQEYMKTIRTSDGGILAIGVLGLQGRITKFNSSFIELWSFGVDSIFLNDVVETNDGNYVILGISNMINFNAGAFIIKMNSLGTVLFKKMYYSSVVSNQFTASGICKAAGTDNGFVFFGGNCFAMDYLIKCDANGNIEWEKQYAGTGNGYLAAMISETNSYVTIFNCMQLGVSSVGILKIDISGNVLWCTVMQSTNGVSFGRNPLTKKNNGDYYIMTTPLDVYGCQNYTVNSAGTSVTCMRHVNAVQLEMTSVIATGNANDELLITGVLSPGYGAYLKLSSSENILYQKQSTTFTSYFMHSTSLNNGTYVMAGSTSAYGKILAVIDESGNGVCTTANLSLTSASYPFNITNPVLIGYPVNVLDTNVNYTIYSVTQPRANLCGSLGSKEISYNTANVEVFPNPSSGIVTVRSETVNSMEIFNSLGEKVYSYTVADPKSSVSASFSITVDLSDQPDGIYFLRIQNEKGLFLSKIILNSEQ